MYRRNIFDTFLVEFGRALAAARRYESLKYTRHGHFARADIPERIFEEFYARPASSAARSWNRPRLLSPKHRSAARRFKGHSNQQRGDVMQQTRQSGGSATRWGALFGERARDWAETWEGPRGYGTPLYEHVLDQAKIGSGSRVLDCGCGAGGFARMAADRGARVAGIDAAEGLIAIAAERTPSADFRLGDLEVLPWPDKSFDVVTGFNAFQFADDKARALMEARRVSRGLVAVVIPTRASESGLTSVYRPLFPLFASEALESMKQSGIFALSEPGKLEETLTAAGLTAYDDAEIGLSIVFDDADAAERALIGAGPTRLAIQNSGEQTVAHVMRDALAPFIGKGGRVTLPGWYRVVLSRG